MNFVISAIAFMLCFAAADVGRTKEGKVKFFSLNWFLQVLLISTAGFILKNINIWFP